MRAIYNQCKRGSSSGAVGSNFTHMRAAKHRLDTMISPLSRCMLDPDGLIGFAQKVSIRRKDSAAGRAMIKFLLALTEFCFCLEP